MEVEEEECGGVSNDTPNPNNVSLEALFYGLNWR